MPYPTSLLRRLGVPRLLRYALLGILLGGGIAVAAAASSPVYVHMNGKNDFLESVVAVRPGQPVIFVNQDTGKHAVAGYNPLTGKVSTTFNRVVRGTPGPGHTVHTYKVVFHKRGIHYYYCYIHARLQKVFGKRVQPAHRKGVPGFDGAMAGVIIVTNDAALIKDDPPSSHKKILPHFYGG